MMATMEWAAYCFVVSAVVALAAWVGERAATEVSRPARGYWLGGMALSLVIPLVAAIAPAWRVPEAVTLVPALPAVPVLMLEGVSTGSSAGWGGGTVLLALWIAATAALAARWLVCAALLRREQRTWRATELDGEPVLRSSRTGPAVVGVRRPRIVLPEWAFEAEPSLTRLMLMHEREHVRAGDPWLLFAGRLLVVLMPWNPVVWWMRERLRLAVEMDCDARVVRGSPDVRAYGTALYEAGRRQQRLALAIAFSERTPWLERRLRRLLGGARRRPGRSVVLAGLAVALVAIAVSARDPLAAAPQAELELTGDAPVIDDIREPTDAESGRALELEVQERLGAVQPRPVDAAAVDTPPTVGRMRRAAQQTDLTREPVFTPYTVAPRLLNVAEVREALARAYPALLKNAGIGGEALVWFYIDEAGRVQNAMLKDGTGYPTLDEAALKVASVMRFEPAINRDRRVPVWVAIPIKFDQPRVGVVERTNDLPPPPDRDVVDQVRRSATSQAGAADQRTRATQAGGAVAINDLPPPRATATAADIAKQPVFTPYTQAPRLLNTREVQQALERNYPALLRNAGIGGEVIVWFYIDQTGQVANTQLKTPSGYPSLDAAALMVASIMRFEPAVNRDKAVAVWVAIPMKFDTK